MFCPVLPAKAGIQSLQSILDSRLRGTDHQATSIQFNCLPCPLLYALCSSFAELDVVQLAESAVQIQQILPRP
jgi:hypothetical protein